MGPSQKFVCDPCNLSVVIQAFILCKPPMALNKEEHTALNSSFKESPGPKAYNPVYQCLLFCFSDVIL